MCAPVKGRLVAYAAASSTQTTSGWQARGHGLCTGHLLDARLQNREQTSVLTVPTGMARERIPIVTGLQR